MPDTARTALNLALTAAHAAWSGPPGDADLASARLAGCLALVSIAEDLRHLAAAEIKLTERAGPRYPVLAFGDTAAEIEQAALHDAQPVFGDTPIHVIPDYLITPVATAGERMEAGGKTLYATVTVQAARQLAG